MEPAFADSILLISNHLTDGSRLRGCRRGGRSGGNRSRFRRGRRSRGRCISRCDRCRRHRRSRHGGGCGNGRSHCDSGRSRLGLARRAWRLGGFVRQNHRGLVVIRLQDENGFRTTNVAVRLFLGLELQDGTIIDTGLNLVAKGEFALVTVAGEQRGHSERTFRPTGVFRRRADVTPFALETSAF